MTRPSADVPGGDADLVRRARDGDHDAFDALVRRHQAAALRLAAVLGGGAEAEDIAQEAFVKAHRNLHRFRADASVSRPGSFRPWLLRIVANTARNHHRARSRRSAATERFARDRLAAGAGGDRAIEAVDARSQLRAAFDRLSVAERHVLALRWFEGLSEAEMAIALDCRPGTVKSRLSRATSRLRAALTDEEVGA